MWIHHDCCDTIPVCGSAATDHSTKEQAGFDMASRLNGDKVKEVDGMGCLRSYLGKN